MTQKFDRRAVAGSAQLSIKKSNSNCWQFVCTIETKSECDMGQGMRAVAAVRYNNSHIAHTPRVRLQHLISRRVTSTGHANRNANRLSTIDFAQECRKPASQPASQLDRQTDRRTTSKTDKHVTIHNCNYNHNILLEWVTA